MCINECVCFNGELAGVESCPKCFEPRVDDHGKPRRTFLYLPLVPQLQRLYSSPRHAKDARWAGEHKRTAGSVRDITESKNWDKYVIRSGFFDDVRNIALALCGDGVNPFRKSAHSVWPLLLSVLNFPPHLRTDLDHLILVGIIPGPRAPKNMNLYLGLVAAEVVTYGELGVWTWDAFAQEDFRMRFEFQRLIADYRGVAKMLCVKGAGAKRGCTECCAVGTKPHGEATQYGGYRCCLPADHPWRTDLELFGSETHQAAPRRRQGNEIRALARCAREARDTFGVKAGSVYEPSAVLGWCPLLYQSSFDPVEMFGPDVMHIVVC